METAITFGYYVSSLGFLIASLIMGLALMKFGKSAIGTALTYFVIGTVTFFVVTIFQKLGADSFGIADESMDIWWHLMFYLALLSYYFGLKTLVGLGNGDASAQSSRHGTVWGLFTAAALVLIFVIPSSVEPFVNIYTSSPPAILGLHHFLAFLLSAIVGWYLLSVKRDLGQIGRAIANPMIVGIWSLGGQHFWELLFESWKWVDVTSEVGEGGEKIFLTITAICVIYAAWRLKSFAQK